MSFGRFTTQAAALALAALTTAGLLGSVDRIAVHEQRRAASELLAERQAAEHDLEVAEAQRGASAAQPQRATVTPRRRAA